MKFVKKLILSLAMCALFTAPFSAEANSSCPDITSPMMEATVYVDDVFEAYHAAYISYIQGNEEFTVQIPYGEMSMYSQYVGQNAVIQYTNVQYFDEHDGECTQTQRISSIGNGASSRTSK